MSLLLGLSLGPVDEKQFVGGSCEGGVQPVDVVGREHVVGHVALVYIYVCPLSSLCLVAGHAVGVFGLQGVVVGIVKRRRDLFREFSLGAGGYAVVIRPPIKFITWTSRP